MKEQQPTKTAFVSDEGFLIHICIVKLNLDVEIINSQISLTGAVKV